VLRDHGLPEPVRQLPVTVGGRNLRLDLAYPDAMVFLEGDGFGVHGLDPGNFENDRGRQNLLVVAGWHPLRFTWRMLVHTPSLCARDVRSLLAKRHRGAPSLT
jgi:hypothetical protein